MSPGRLVFATLSGLLPAAFQVAAVGQEIPAPLLACTAEKDESRRLACFDAALEQMREGGGAPATAAVTAPAPRATDAAGAPTATAGASPAPTATAASSPAPTASAGTPRVVSPEEEFGLRGELREEKLGELSELVAAVTDVRSKPHGELVVTLANGQVWAEIASGSKIKLKTGDTVKIQSGALRSFILVAPNGRSSKVSRIR